MFYLQYNNISKMFVIHKLTFTTFEKSEVIHNHQVAFQRAIQDIKNASMVYMTERRWCNTKNMMLTINYTVVNDCVFLSNDCTKPVYSINPLFETLMKFREDVYKLMKHVIWIYSVAKGKLPYNLEYIYSFSEKELQNLIGMVRGDTLYLFYDGYINAKISHLKSIFDCTDLNTNHLFGTIYTINSSYVLAYINILYEIAETWTNASIYGGSSYIKEFFENRLNPIKGVTT